MYQPRLFREDDRDRLHDLIAAHSFGTLIVARAGGQVEISHVPFLLDRTLGPNGTLRLHVARANPIWRLAVEATQVTAVFQGPHAFVSAGWYEHPTEQVPTWNYAVVHAQGVAKQLEREALLRLLDDLAAEHERGAWHTGLLDPSFRDQLALQIVGVSIEVEKLDGKFKLSQNRSPADHDLVVKALQARATGDDVAVAELMLRGGGRAR